LDRDPSHNKDDEAQEEEEKGGAPVISSRMVKQKMSARIKKGSGRHSTSNSVLCVNVSGAWLAWFG
jgi:hypothetical protein